MYISPLVAIDIGSYSLKVIELVAGSKPSLRRVKSLGELTLPAGAVSQGIIQAPEVVGEQLRLLLRHLGIGYLLRRAAISVGGGACMIKVVDFDLSGEQDLEEEIFSQAEEVLQTDINDLYFDYFEQQSFEDSSKIRVVLAGARREIVDARISLIKQLKLKVGVVDCEAFALTNTVEQSYGSMPGLVMVVNIGLSSSQVIFIRNGQYLYNRDLGSGGEFFTRSIADASGFDMDRAERTKIDYSLGKLEPSSEIVKSIGDAQEQFVNDLQMICDFFFQSPAAPVDDSEIRGVLLTGGGALLTGLQREIADRLATRVELLNPFQHTEETRQYSSKSLYSRKCTFATAFGLGLREYSF